MIHIKASALFLSLFAAAGAAFGQPIPDANIRFPEIGPRLAPPVPSPDLRLPEAPLAAPGQAGGASFVLRAVEFSGNTRLSAAELQAVVAPWIGKPLDLSGVQRLANDLTERYRQAGYPVARVYLPAQDVKDGRVRMAVLEGRFGERVATLAQGDRQQPSPDAQPFLGTLDRGDVIEGQVVERTALIMNDIPGYTAVPILRPGASQGEGDLEMRMIPDPRQSTTRLSLDNHGSKFTGLYRVRLDHERTRNWIFGDQLRLTALATDRNTGMVNAVYGFPLMPNGLRLELQALHSVYKLSGGSLEGAGFRGSAQTVGGQVSYPLVRAQTENLTLLGGLQRRWYTNQIGVAERYTLDSVPISAQFDVRDSLLGGAVTYGVATWLHARVAKDNLPGADRDTSYQKFNLDIARLQRLTDRLQLSGKYAGQYTRDRIDATEFSPMAGPTAVRAFPIGEFSGHRTSVGQLELRYLIPDFNLTPFLFFDGGRGVNTTTQQRRLLTGPGAGIAYATRDVTGSLTLAWPRQGKPSTVEPDASGPRIWASLSARF